MSQTAYTKQKNGKILHNFKIYSIGFLINEENNKMAASQRTVMYLLCNNLLSETIVLPLKNTGPIIKLC